MRRWLNDLDRILRGEATRLSALREGQIEMPVGGLALVILLLAVLYGVCMGSYAVFRPDGPVFMQLAASSAKVPAVFFLTLLVTFPSLYVSNAMVGSRLSFLTLFRLMIGTLAVNVAVLASLGPIVAFFSVTTTSYPFILLLNVAVSGVSGCLGVAFLLQTLHRLTLAAQIEPPRPRYAPLGAQGVSAQASPTTVGAGSPAAELPSNEAAVEAQVVAEPGALERPDPRAISRRVKVVVHCWVVMFAVVGAQMAWVLRPFVGKPLEPFQWFCARESNFFQAVWNTICVLFS